MSGTTAGTIVTTCLEAWTSGDLATARSLLRDDVVIVGPLGANEGVEKCMAELEELAKIVTGIEQKRVIVVGNEVYIFYDLLTVPAGRLPASGWYHIHDDKIDSIRDYFDARMLIRTSGTGTPDPLPYRRPVVGNRSSGSCLPVFHSAELEIADWDEPS